MDNFDLSDGWEGTYWHGDNSCGFSGSFSICLDWFPTMNQHAVAALERLAKRYGRIDLGDEDFGVSCFHFSWKKGSPYVLERNIGRFAARYYRPAPDLFDLMIQESKQ